MEITHHYYIGIIVFVIILIILVYLYTQKNQSPLFSQNLLAILQNHRFRLRTKWILIVCIILSCFLLSQPKAGLETHTKKTKGCDILIALDVSQSMKAMDVIYDSQIIDRLSYAKLLVHSYIKDNTHNRIGLVAFAGEAITVSPLTLDHSTLSSFLNNLDYTQIKKQGSNFVSALKTSLARFNEEKERVKIIVFLSDGENDFDQIESILNDINNSGIRIFSIGIGSIKGAKIPEFRDVFGRTQYKTFNGETVITKLDEKYLKKISAKTNGKYFNSQNVQDPGGLQDELNGLKTSTLKVSNLEKKAELYPYLALLILLLLLSETLWEIRGVFLRIRFKGL